MRARTKRMAAWVGALSLTAGLLTSYGSLPAQAITPPQAPETQQTAAELRETLNFNQGWGFYRGDLTGAEGVSFDDSGFVDVTIPHVMRLEKKHNDTTNGVYKGVGWYRRYFTLDESYQGKKLQLKFEGVMTDSDIYLNGEKIYTRNGGYMGFTIDITDKVLWDQENVLALRVSNADNPDTPPGRPDSNLDFHYYGGIYRDVELEVSEMTYVTDELAANEVAGGGVFITYPEVNEDSADVHVKTHVQNDNSEAKTVYTKQILKDADGNVVAESTSAQQEIPSGQGVHFEQDMTVDNPNLWGVDDPYLYQLVTQVYEDGVQVDEVENHAGIRTIAYKPDGFYLNGERIYLRGANRHQSFQNVGDAAPNSMQYRDAVIMKENGFNAVRATHYPQDPAFLDACDELGLLVIECQPGWQNFTNSQAFYDNTIRDTREMIRRDRNRPSVILWETSLNETHYSEQWAKDATTAAHEEYPGDQLFTAADYGLQGTLYDVCYKVQDTQWSNNPADWVDYDPNKPFFTREWGDYEGSSKAMRKDGEAAMNTQIMTRQRYLNGNGYSDWGGLDASERIGGHFLWSWNDYTRGSNTVTLGSGTVDIDRYEKYCYYWLQSMQPADNPVYGPMIFISTAYTENSSLTVPVYSNCDSVRLYQNGTLVKEITREEAGASVPNIMKKGGSPIFQFELSQFEAGTLKAEGIVDGQVVTQHEVTTPGQAVALELEVRDRGLAPVADGSDLIPVHIKAVDANGTVVPDFDGRVHVSVTGNGKLVGEDIPRIKVEDQKLENGIGFAFVRASDVAGDVTITATADGVESGVKTVTTQASTDKFVPAGADRGWADSEAVLEDPVLENIAVDKPVQASSQQSGNEIDHLVDDDEGTRWCASGEGLPQWVEVDLGQANALAGFQMLWEKGSSVYQYTIEVSNDQQHWNTVLDMTENSAVNPSTETQMVKAEGRFVRLTVTGVSDGWASLFEFRVIPDRDADPVNPGEEIPDEMIDKFVASEGSVEGRGPELVRDGETNIGTGWLSPSPKTFPQTLEMYFTQPQTLLGSAIWWEKDSTKITYDLEVKKFGQDWQPVLQGLEETWHDEEPETFLQIQEDVMAIRVVIHDKFPVDADLGMAEWKVFGYTYEEPQPEPEKEYEYASDLEWTDAHSDYGSVTKDAAAYGGSLVLNSAEGRQTFDKGLGADTNSYILYNVEGKRFCKFESYIGINANASKQGGEAIFRIYVDDQMVYESPVMMRDDNCEFVSVELPETAKQVKLEAVWSGNTENPEARYNTHVDWADAKFYLTPTPTFQVTVEAEDATMGTVSIRREDGVYRQDETAKVIASPNPGYAFVAWVSQEDGTILSTQRDYAFTVTQDVNLVARFQPVKSANKELLQKTYDYALTLSTEGVTDAAKAAFEEALTNAKAVLADDKATQEEVNAAWDALLEGIWGLGLTQGDKTMLEQLIAKAEDMTANADKYVADHWQELVDALAKAKDVAADGDAMEEDVQPAAQALLDAILAQRFKADKSILEDLLNKAENLNLEGYTADSVAVFRSALAEAQAVMADETLTEDDQNTVDAAVAALSDAMNGLTAEGEAQPSDKPETTDTPEASQKPEATQKPENVPQTGDTASLLPWAAALALSGTAALWVVRRKERN